MKMNARVSIVHRFAISCRTVLLLTAIVLASRPAAKCQTTNGADQIIPLIQFVDVPITTAIENLARQSDLNYIIDPDLFPISGNHQEPTVSFQVRDESAKSVLKRMLELRKVTMIDDPITQVTRIAARGKVYPKVDTSLFDASTNGSVANADIVIPLIQFEEAPLDVALNNLIRQSGMKIELATHNSDGSDAFNPNPILHVRWTKLTCKQAIIALCQNYKLIFVKDAKTGILQIRALTEVK